MEKICKRCNRLLPFSAFMKNGQRRDGLDKHCRECRKERAREEYVRDPFITYIRTKRAECKKKGFAFNLTSDYLRSIWSGVCPIFGCDIFIGGEIAKRDFQNVAHLDRFDPDLGYIQGNVNFISGRANRIKLNASTEELQMIVKWMNK